MARARSLTNFSRRFPTRRAARPFCSNVAGRMDCLSACGNARAAALRSGHTLTNATVAAARLRSRRARRCTAQGSVDGVVLGAHLMSTHSNGMSARQLEDHSASLTGRFGCWRRSCGDRWSTQTENLSKGSLKSIKRKSPSARATHSSSPAMLAKSSSSGPSRWSIATPISPGATQAREISRHAFRSHPPRRDSGQFRRLDRSFRAGQRKARRHAVDRRPFILSRLDRLSA